MNTGYEAHQTFLSETKENTKHQRLHILLDEGENSGQQAMVLINFFKGFII